jgi:hypothetical protein
MIKTLSLLAIALVFCAFSFGQSGNLGCSNLFGPNAGGSGVFEVGPIPGFSPYNTTFLMTSACMIQGINAPISGLLNTDHNGGSQPPALIYLTLVSVPSGKGLGNPIVFTGTFTIQGSASMVSIGTPTITTFKANLSSTTTKITTPIQMVPIAVPSPVQ